MSKDKKRDPVQKVLDHDRPEEGSTREVGTCDKCGKVLTQTYKRIGGDGPAVWHNDPHECKKEKS